MNEEITEFIKMQAEDWKWLYNEQKEIAKLYKEYAVSKQEENNNLKKQIKNRRTEKK